MKILVTGGTGSMGRTLVRRLVDNGWPGTDEIIVFSRDEAKQFEMQQQYRKNPAVRFILGDMRNYDDVFGAMRGADVVIHTAALKQVPSCELWPEQAVLTNCLGMANIVKAVPFCRYLDTVVVLSTDKACKPTTAMGMTKALQEKIMVAAATRQLGPRFVGVRYGNVLTSRGSVVPLFQQQIAAGGPVTITEGAMTRFLLTLQRAVDTIIEALEHGRPGEIIVPKAPSARVGLIAATMIGDKQIPIEVIGRRPGEKMHEIMVSKEESLHTIGRNGYYVIEPQLLTKSEGDHPSYEYSSGDYNHQLSPEHLRELLKEFELCE